MKKCLLILFLVNFSFLISQNKEDLIHSIIEINVLESQYVGYAGRPSSQFENFQKLTKLISDDELIELSKHENDVLRTYVIQHLVKTKSKTSLELFSQEIFKNEKIKTLSGCVRDLEDIYSTIYHSYRNHLISETSKKFSNEYERKVAVDNKLRFDSVLLKLDSINYIRKMKFIG